MRSKGYSSQFVCLFVCLLFCKALSYLFFGHISNLCLSLFALKPIFIINSSIHIQLGESLHTQLVNLVGRLHEVEVERHSLLLQLDQSKSEQDRLSGACQDALEMESQVERLRKDVAGMVAHERFMAVCSDLEVALKREQELKVSLTQHGVAVKQLQERLQLEGKNLQAKNDAMSVVDKVNKGLGYHTDTYTRCR